MNHRFWKTGLGWSLLTALCFSLTGFAIRLSPWGANEYIAVRNGIVTLILGVIHLYNPLLWNKQLRLRLTRGEWTQGLAGFASGITILFAVKGLDPLIATSLLYCSPLWTFAFSLSKKTVVPLRTLPLLLALVIAIAVMSRDAARGSTGLLLVGIMSGVLFALWSLLTRHYKLTEARLDLFLQYALSSLLCGAIGWKPLQTAHLDKPTVIGISLGCVVTITGSWAFGKSFASPKSSPTLGLVIASLQVPLSQVWVSWHERTVPPLRVWICAAIVVFIAARLSILLKDENG